MKIPLRLDEASFLCPITGQVITDPVVDHEGNSYEKTAILEWLSRNQTSPITRSPLLVHQLAPNRILKELLEEDAFNEASISGVCPPSCKVSTQVITSADGHALIQVSVADEKSTSHSPASVICVLDVSGSMTMAATMHNDKEGCGGLSLLDIVKHATRTVIETLSPEDRLSVIAYSNAAQLLLPLTYMTSENKQKAWKTVGDLSASGGTNLWGGLAEAMYIANLEEGDHCHILLLTDGQPTMHPPRGELETLCRYRQRNPKMKATISTFGFGYSIQSKLLRDIAVEGNGHYCFIPDSSFVGTVFVNATANMLATALPESILLVEGEVEDLSGLRGVSDLVTGCCSPTRVGPGEGSKVLKFNLPPLIYGQTLDILVKASGKVVIDWENVTLTDMKFQALCTTTKASDKNALDFAMFRSKTVRFVESSMHKLSVNPSVHVFSIVQKDLKGLYNPCYPSTAHIQALCSDLDGQIAEAFSRFEWYQKWGRHYLPSLCRAYALQQCTNFKDPGVQIYATDKFALLRDESEEIFCKLPPPTPSRKFTEDYAPVRSMSAYYQSSVPCFARGDVKLGDGSQVDITELRSGDVVASSDEAVRVKCIVKTYCENGIQELVELDEGVLVTPWHPVREPGASQWIFPYDLAPSSECQCDAVYSFVLDGGTFLQIGPYQGIALDHGITNDPVVEHGYLGTEKVVADLEAMDGWAEGFVVLGSKPCLRDPETGLVVDIVQEYVLNSVLQGRE